MLDVDEAFDRLAGLIEPVRGTERVLLADLERRVPVEDVLAPVSLPPFDASAMDGYAVVADGVAPGTRLRVVGESLAGHPSATPVGAGEAVRIFTGAAMPAGADSVVIQEDVRRHGDVIEVGEPARAGDNVRPAGNDVARGAPLCRAGHRLTTYDLARLAACGIAALRVRRRVRVAVFSTGDELADVGASLGPGQIYDSNRFAVARLLRERGAEIVDLGCVPDDVQRIRSALADAAQSGDLVVTSGGVSVGDADLVRDVVAELGAIDFWRIALKPGKPLAVGNVGGTPFFGLPGNPVSTLVTGLLFVAPAVDLLGGAAAAPPLAIPAVLAEPVAHAPGRREYMRGIAAPRGGRLEVAINGDQGSNRLATFSGANCLVLIPGPCGDLEAGAPVDIHLLGADGHPLPVPARAPADA